MSDVINGVSRELLELLTDAAEHGTGINTPELMQARTLLTAQPQSAPAGEREAFEAWYERTFGARAFAQNVDGSYADELTEMQWAGWQARASWQRTQAAVVPDDKRSRVALSYADHPFREDTLRCPADTKEELYGALKVLAAAYRQAIAAPAHPAAQDQGEAVECMLFEYRHPDSGEERTVAITRKDVADGMEDKLFEELCDQICRCESVGETNVVECNCSDYADEFQLLAAAPVQPPARDQGEVQRLRLDAARYRVLRAHGRHPIAVRNHLSHLFHESLDAAVDDLLAASTGQEV